MIVDLFITKGEKRHIETSFIIKEFRIQIRFKKKKRSDPEPRFCSESQIHSALVGTHGSGTTITVKTVSFQFFSQI